MNPFFFLVYPVPVVSKFFDLGIKGATAKFENEVIFIKDGFISVVNINIYKTCILILLKYELGSLLLLVVN